MVYHGSWLEITKPGFRTERALEQLHFEGSEQI